MSTGSLATTRTICYGRASRIQAASDFITVAAFGSLGLIASMLFVVSGGLIGF